MDEDLEQTCLNADLPKVKLLLESGISPNSDTITNPKRSILTSTCLLLERKVYCEQNILYNYIKFPKVSKLKEIISLLLEHGGNVSDFDRVGNNAFLCCIKSGDVEIVRQLLANGANSNLCGKNKASALHIACATSWNDPFEIVQELLSYGADPLLRDSEQCIALHYACKNGHIKCVKKLLEVSPPSVNYYDKSGNTPIILAVQTRALINNVSEIVKLLIETDPLCIHHTEPVFGRTALYYSVKYHNVEVTKMLLCAGSNINNTNQSSALHIACNTSWIDPIEMLPVLLSWGADPLLRDGKLCIALHYACKNGHIKSVKKLLEVSPSSVNYFDDSGNTPIILAVQSRELMNNAAEIVKLLVETDPSCIHTETIFGRTALHYSAMNHNIEVTKILLHAGSNANSVDNDHRTPLHLALNNIDFIAKFKHCKLTKLLFNAGANPHIRDAAGLTVLETFLSSRRPLRVSGQSQTAPFYALNNEDASDTLEYHFFAGADVTKLSSNVQMIESILFKFSYNQTSVIKRMVMYYGYPRLPDNYLEVSLKHSKSQTETVLALLDFQNSVKSLQCIAAKILRISLRPNAIVGLDMLQVSSHVKKIVLISIQ